VQGCLSIAPPPPETHLFNNWQTHGEITYNGTTFAGFIPQRTAAYVEQTDLHLPELTVRETMNFAARVQGVGHRAGTPTAISMSI